MDNRPTSLELEDFMAFHRARFEFGRDLNVFVGENGTGKSQLLKLVYSVLAVLHKPPPGFETLPGFPSFLLRQKISGVFRPGASLAQLVRGNATQARVVLNRRVPLTNLVWSILNPESELVVEQAPVSLESISPVFIPPVDLLSFYPGFVSTYSARHVEFDETWYDTAVLLGQPPLKQLQPELAHQLGLVEGLMDGKVELDPSGRFQLALSSGGKREIPLVAEGLRKLGGIARLIVTGSLQKGTSLFWDEPESNLNPKLIKEVAKLIVALSRFGVQVFIATHSIFLLRELEMFLATEFAPLDARFFGLQPSDTGVVVSQGPTPEDMGSIALLDEELTQSDRFLAEEDP